MYGRRRWAVRNARWLSAAYRGLERFLILLHPLFARLGYKRLDPAFLLVEKSLKGFLFDSQSCGQCALSETGMSCPTNCPKTMRNGPCGGVRPDGGCEVKPDMPCVWVLAWEGKQRMNQRDPAVNATLPPVDARLKNTSAWLRKVREHHGHPEPEWSPAATGEW